MKAVARPSCVRPAATSGPCGGCRQRTNMSGSINHLPIGVGEVIIPIDCAVKMPAFPMESKAISSFACDPDIYEAFVGDIKTELFAKQLTIDNEVSELQFGDSLQVIEG